MEELSLDPVQSSGEFEDGFTWESEVQPFEGLDKDLEDTNINILKLKVKVTWTEERGRTKSYEMVSLKTVVEDED
jgi:hypothetical protein